MPPKVSASDPAAKYPSRVLRVLWWTLVVTPGVSLVFAVAAAMFADSADEAIPFGEVPLFLVMLVAGASPPIRVRAPHRRTAARRLTSEVVYPRPFSYRAISM